MLARTLSIAEFGLFYSIITVFLFISYFVDAGMGQAVARKIVEFNVHKKSKIINDLVLSVASVQFTISLIIGGVIVLLSNYLSINYFRADASLLIILMTIWLLLSPIFSMFAYILYGFQRSVSFAVIDLLKYFFLLIFSFLGIMLGWGVKAPVLAYSVTFVVLIIIAYVIVRRIYSVSAQFHFRKDLTIEIIKFGSMIFISNLAWVVMTQFDTMMLTYYRGNVEVALYQAAVPISSLLLYVTTALSLVIYPIASELHTRKEHAKLVEGIKIIYKYLLMIILPAAALMFSFPDIIINIIFTGKYIGAVNALKILSILAIFFSICLLNSNLLNALGKPEKVAKTMGIMALINILLNFILVPKLGIIGAASSTLTSFIIGAVALTYITKKEIDIKIPYYSWSALAIISIGLLFLINLLRQVILLDIIAKLIVISAIASITYILALFLFRVLNIDDVKFIRDSLLKK
jgi:stage V sporulation protein B